MTSHQQREILARNDFRRKVINALMLGLMGVAALVAITPLFLVLYYVFSRGAAGLNLNFFTELPKPVGEVGGGLGNAILGTLIVVTLAALGGVPIGIFTGVFLSEFRRSRLAVWVRSAVELLAGVPSIIVGMFAYALIVVPMKGFSVLAGAFALAVILVPTVAKVTEEILLLVPDHIREAGLGLGLPRWKVILHVVLLGSKKGIVTGVMLAIARVAGETAPLLFTALSSQYWPEKLSEPTATLPVQIFTYAISPFEDWNQLAWTGALVLVSIVLFTNIIMRALVRR